MGNATKLLLTPLFALDKLCKEGSAASGTHTLAMPRALQGPNTSVTWSVFPHLSQAGCNLPAQKPAQQQLVAAACQFLEQLGMTGAVCKPVAQTALDMAIAACPTGLRDDFFAIDTSFLSFIRREFCTANANDPEEAEIIELLCQSTTIANCKSSAERFLEGVCGKQQQDFASNRSVSLVL